MTDLPAGNLTERSVSELSIALKRTVEDAFGFVRVRGEVSGFRGPVASGHVYFCLKDQNARLDAVIWKGVFGRMRFRPEDGMEVVATGKVTTFPGKSTYQMVIETLEPAGVGALLLQLEERRKRLAAEGLFDPARRQLLPYLPDVIGVVTSPTGAVIRDIIHRIADRFPRHVLVWPVRVQGETSAAEVAAAIRGFNALEPGGRVPRPDVIIVARGGGSLEDLWGFNEEIVVRAAAESGIPLVSAVGHETDWTLIDHASDLRAPTPTAAAELVVPVRSELMTRSGSLGLRLATGLRRFIERRRAELRSTLRALPTPEALLAAPRQRLDLQAGRLSTALGRGLDRRRIALSAIGARLQRRSPHAALREHRARLEAVGNRLAQADRVLRRMRADRVVGLHARLGTALRVRLAQETARITDGRRRLVQTHGRLLPAVRRLLEHRRSTLDASTKLMGSLDYRSVLARGFALVRSPDGTLLRQAAGARPGARIEIELADGRLAAVVGDDPGAADPRPRRKATAAAPPGGDLFG